MKLFYSIFIIFICWGEKNTYADSQAIDESTLQSSNIIFNWAEQQFFQFFPNYASIFPLNTQTIIHPSGWIYRYYLPTDNYIGIFNHDVYITGASFFTATEEIVPIKVASITDTLNAVFATPIFVNNIEPSGIELPFRNLLSSDGSLSFRNGGYGSAIAPHPTNKNQFYALTDRGPTAAFTGEDGKGKIFPIPDFSPRIGLFELTSANSIVWIKDILFKDTQGTPITGLPNSKKLGGTGEVPYDTQGNTLLDAQGNIRWDDFGLDSEGMVALKDGTFWVSDEYGPHIVHYDRDGKEIGRINPFTKDARTHINLPAEFSNREPNRGMEGLTITPDQKMLVGIMQSTLQNPNDKVLDSKLTRIITIHLETGVIGQYLYKQRKKQNSNSDIIALSATQFLVIERDGGFLNGGSKNASADSQKLIYLINLNTATNLETIPLTKNLSQDKKQGLMIKNKTLEQTVINNGWGSLDKQGIQPVTKTLIVDVVAELNYPHDKLEGLWVIDAQTIAVLNDDDFASWPTKGDWGTKYINAEKTKIDANTLYIIKGLNLNLK